MGFMIEMEITSDKQKSCTKCRKTFDKPELIQYYVCPHCKSKIEEELKTGCQYWLGYLNDREKGEPMPPECVECEKVVECMLNKQYQSETAVAEIKKWY
jgi:hypothetical protein